MKNQDQWIPTKFVYHHGKLRASRDPQVVAIGDRLIADLVAGLYDLYLRQYALGRLVDLGSGRVPLYAAYREYITANVCVDWGNTLHKSSHLDYECDLTGKLPFRSGEFDTILLSDVLEHIPDPQGLWHEMSRILLPGGTILLNVPFFFRLHEEPFDYYRYTEYALRRFAEQNGFEVLVLHPIGGSPEVFADLLGKHLRFVPLIGHALVIAVHAITRAFISTSLGRRMSTATGKIFPLGYFLVARKTISEPLPNNDIERSQDAATR